MSSEPWIEYFQNVLGVSQVLIPASAFDTVAKEESLKNFSILFLAQKDSLSIEAREMLSRMILAMRVDLKRVHTMEVDLDLLFQKMNLVIKAKVVISFSEELSSFLQANCPHLAVITTHSPQLLLTRSELKKSAWESLQRAMQILAKDIGV